MAFPGMRFTSRILDNERQIRMSASKGRDVIGLTNPYMVAKASTQLNVV